MTTKSFSIAITGAGAHRDPFISHVTKKYPQITMYDRTAAVTAFRQGEVDLARQGHLDAESTRRADQIAKSLANPIKVDVTLDFKTSDTQLLVDVVCASGKKQQFTVQLYALFHDDLSPAYVKVDAAIFQCTAKPGRV